MGSQLARTQPHEPNEGNNNEHEAHYLRGPKWPHHQTIDAKSLNEKSADRVQSNVTEYERARGPLHPSAKQEIEHRENQEVPKRFVQKRRMEVLISCQMWWPIVRLNIELPR